MIYLQRWEEISMEKKDMDWGNIGFGYHITDE